MKSRIDFSDWDRNLLLDYVLVMHHDRIRKYSNDTLLRLEKLALGNDNLIKAFEIFRYSLSALDEHFFKEENVLFPYIKELLKAEKGQGTIGEFHCGTVQNPINVMMSDHEEETSRHEEIMRLTDNYLVGKENEELSKVMEELKDFRENLLEHIYIENNILFPYAIEIERKLSNL